ncbi:MAG: MMPL family transporter [Pseudomonadota bacterium]
MQKILFLKLSEFITTYPRKIVAVALILSLISIILSVTLMRVDADQDNLVSEKLEYHKRYKDFMREFGDQEYLYIIVEADGNIKDAKKFTESLATRLKDAPEIKRFLYKIENKQLEKNFMIYLTEDELENLHQMLGNPPFAVKDLSQVTTLSQLFGLINRGIEGSLSSEDEKRWTAGFTFIDKLISGMTEALDNKKEYEPFLEGVFFGGNGSFDEDGFLITKNRKFLVSLVMPQKDYSTMEVIDKPLKIIRSALDDTRQEFPDVKAGLTGRPVLSADEMKTTTGDMTKATILAIILVGIIFSIFLKGIHRPALAVISLIIGISWSFGLLAVTFGRLNLLSSVFALVLVGATIEYGIHIVARYREELARFGYPNVAIKETLLHVGPANLTSALTTALAFAAISWSKFIALGELGFIAASGVILCLISMTFVLPALLIIVDSRQRYIKDHKPLPRLNRFVELQHYPRTIITFVILITLISPFFLAKVKFDNNLLNLQATGLESVEYEKRLIDESDESSWFSISIASDIEKSNGLAQKFKSLPTVKRVDSIETLFPPDQEKRISLVQKIKPIFDSFKFLEPSEKINSDELKSELLKFRNRLGEIQEEAFSGGRADAVGELEQFITKVSELINKLIDPQMNLSSLSDYQIAILKDLSKKFDLLKSGMDPSTISLDDLPEELKERYLSPNGKFAVYAIPKENIWEPEKLETFVADIRSIDPLVTGVPIEVYESGKLMRQTFIYSAIIAYVLILIISFIHFRKIKESLLAVLPLSLGLIWLVAAMGSFGIQFNMANFFGIPILIGIGIDAGIHLIHRIKEEGIVYAIGGSTGRGILLTGIANAIGFGAMMIASHRGIFSLGQIMTIGSILITISALVAVPAIAGRIFKFGNNLY